MTLLALTLRQPWAFAVTNGKDVENRTWPPPLGLTEVAIHAGAQSGWDDDGEFSPLVIRAWREHVANLPPMNAATPCPRRESLHMDFSAIVAVARVAGCHRWSDRECGQGTGTMCSPWAAAYQVHWQLAEVRTLARPVPCRGRQKLWTVPEDVESAVRAQLGEQ